MVLKLSPEAQARILEIAERGNFTDESDVVLRAVDLLEQDLRRRHIDSLLERAATRAETEGSTPMTPDLFRSITERVTARVKSGARRTHDPDVWPPDECWPVTQM